MGHAYTKRHENSCSRILVYGHGSMETIVELKSYKGTWKTSQGRGTVEVVEILVEGYQAWWI